MINDELVASVWLWGGQGEVQEVAAWAKSLGGDAFKRWDGGRHMGPFLISGFDAIAHGVASNLDKIENLTGAPDWLKERVRKVWNEADFIKNSGMGVRGTTRLKNLLPFGEKYFSP